MFIQFASSDNDCFACGHTVFDKQVKTKHKQSTFNPWSDDMYVMDPSLIHEDWDKMATILKTTIGIFFSKYWFKFHWS